MSQENNTSDEVNLLHYWEILRVRKRLFMGIFFIVVLSVTVVNLALPAIYRGEFFMKAKMKDCNDIFKTLKIDSQLKKNIFRQTYHLITNVDLRVLTDTPECKLQLIVESKDTTGIIKIADEFIDYINNQPYQKKCLAQQKELIQGEINAYTASIDYINELLTSHPDKVNSESFGVKQLLDEKIELEKKKLFSEVRLKNLSGPEVMMQEVYPTPVKPEIAKNIILSVVVGFLLALLSVYFADIKDRVSGTPSQQRSA